MLILSFTSVLAACAAWPIPVDDPVDPFAAAIERVLAGNGEKVTRIEIGKTAGGRPLTVLRAGAKDAPALLVVSGLDGRLEAGPEIACLALERLLGKHADLLADHAIYVLPCLNGDAAARAADSQILDVGGTLRPRDDDRDGRTDEDSPGDVNGDGKIGWMRVMNPPVGTPLTDIADPDDPRRSRAADRAKGEVPAFVVWRESLDRDGDGRYGEDALGGVDLDRNFPHQYVERDARSGPSALSEGESRALVDWMLSRSDIEAVLVLGNGDTLIEPWEAGKMDVTKRAPAGLEKADHALALEIKKRVETSTGWKKGRQASVEGSLVGYAYGQYGVPAFSFDVTRNPERDRALLAPPAEAGAAKEGEEKKDAAKPEEGKDGEKKEGGKGAKSAGKGDKKGGDDAEAQLLTAAEQEGQGFTPFQPFAHPTLGPVEIGGLDDSFALTPPAAAVSPLADQAVEVAAILLAALPKVSYGKPTVEKLSDGVYRVRIDVRNDGFFPSLTAIAEKLRRRGSLAFQLELPRERVPAGRLTQLVRSVKGGGGIEAVEWVVLGTEGESISIDVRSPRTGAAVVNVKLSAEAGR